jgi:hypothetical protein
MSQDSFQKQLVKLGVGRLDETFEQRETTGSRSSAK